MMHLIIEFVANMSREDEPGHFATRATLSICHLAGELRRDGPLMKLWKICMLREQLFERRLHHLDDDDDGPR